MKVTDPLLFPFAALYDGVTRLRNHLYDIAWYKSVSFDRPVLAVGNVTVGGTGKTPMVEYLVRLLKDRYRLGIVSRGYGRKTRGFRLAGPEEDAESLGDEPYQYYRSWGEEVAVAVGEQRAMAIAELLWHRPEVEVILLDDAYQHRAVRADAYIMLSNWQRPFYKDRLLPLGRLREARSGVKRASAVVMTKCPPNLPEEERQRTRQRVTALAGQDLPVFFAGLAYGKARPLQEDLPPLQPESPVILLSGIAQPKPLEAYVQVHYQLREHMVYTDHHAYRAEDIKKVADRAKAEGAALLTTEKDASKLLSATLRPLWAEVQVYTLPVQHTFMQEEAAFQNLILQTVEQKRHAAQAE